MTQVRLTKNELRTQQQKLTQLMRYLPTLQLKKAMLQTEVHEARLEIRESEKNFTAVRDKVAAFSALLTDREAINFDDAVKVTHIDKRYENIAGIDIPYFDGIHFADYSYDLFETPAWTDAAIASLRGLAEFKARVDVAKEKKTILEKELREVSIRVNLFEKILIPRAKKNIKRIKIFLGDQQLAAVSQAKVAKAIIEENNEAMRASRS